MNGRVLVPCIVGNENRIAGGDPVEPPIGDAEGGGDEDERRVDAPSYNRQRDEGAERAPDNGIAAEGGSAPLSLLDHCIEIQPLE